MYENLFSACLRVAQSRAEPTLIFVLLVLHCSFTIIIAIVHQAASFGLGILSNSARHRALTYLHRYPTSVRVVAPKLWFWNIIFPHNQEHYAG